MTDFFPRIAAQLNIRPQQVIATIQLLESGATIPFISRYRKEKTDNLDEVQIGKIKDLQDYFTTLEKRKETILTTIDKQGLLTAELRKKITETFDANELEDIYLPFKPKKRTRATIAKEKGLELTAAKIFKQIPFDLDATVSQHLATGKFENKNEILQGCRDIIAEQISENARMRQQLRQLFFQKGILTAKVVKTKQAEADKYRDFFDFSQSVRQIPSHRLLAINRGHNEKFLRIKAEPHRQDAEYLIERQFVKEKNNLAEQVLLATKDAYDRLIQPSLENETLNHFLRKAEETAIEVFALNVRQLLLASPLGNKRILALDPGFSSGCKLVCLDEKGDLLHNETIYPHPPQKEVKQAKHKVASLVEAYKIDAIAIGNGTAGRETEWFIKGIIFKNTIQVFVVNEAGASIYSASAVGREEFPQYDVTVRGAVSIGRRLMDPLAELVKINPKSIGVGQYQHDVNQKNLKEALGRIVESAVNSVGINVNTAGKYLLQYVSGIGSQLAENIVNYRKENGQFTSRNDLKKVPKLGNKAFEQCAGFLRIPGGSNPLDNTAVHPERYELVKKIAKDLNLTITELSGKTDLRNLIRAENYLSNDTGQFTIDLIIEDLEKPGRDPRQIIKVFSFDPDIRKIEDLHTGMVLPGIITNITKFGVFVDIGIKENGLIHISNLKDGFVDNPADVVQLNQQLQVKVIDIDIPRKRIQLSLKDV
ncbi:MAG: RNA-binding transcriptional accessory protein [Bacteroidales bacterium]|nr:RNA-binding transcriptional accessory protein [Bacteroidales bacterium]